MLICELLADPSFSSFKLLAGASGVQNCISTVTVVDTPDGAKWLNGGEFVITTGFMLGDDEGSLLEFLRLLCEKGVAGLGIKQNRYTTLIPESARMLADDQGLPLISIPESYAFVDIINPVLTRIIDRQAFQLSQTNLIHNKFLDLAVNDRPVFEILQELSLILGIPSSFIDTYFKKIYHSDTSSNFAKQVDEVDPGRITLELLSGYDYYKVAKQNQTFGYMLFPKGKLNQEVGSISRVAVEQAAIVLILRMQVRVSNKYVEDRYKNVFLEDLLLNNIKSESEIHNRALLYGWDFHSGGLVAVVDINNIKKHFAQQLDADKSAMLDQVADTIFEVSCREMLREFPDAKCMRQSDLFTYVLSAGGYNWTPWTTGCGRYSAESRRSWWGSARLRSPWGSAAIVTISGISAKATPRRVRRSIWVISCTGMTVFCSTMRWGCTGCCCRCWDRRNPETIASSTSPSWRRTTRRTGRISSIPSMRSCRRAGT